MDSNLKENISVIEDNYSVSDDECNVIMYNDDVTPFEYVVMVLNLVFNKSVQLALDITLRIHRHGEEVVARLPMDQAYEKLEIVNSLNEENGMVLQCQIEIA